MGRRAESVYILVLCRRRCIGEGEYGASGMSRVYRGCMQGGGCVDAVDTGKAHHGSRHAYRVPPCHHSRELPRGEAYPGGNAGVREPRTAGDGHLAEERVKGAGDSCEGCMTEGI